MGKGEKTGFDAADRDPATKKRRKDHADPTADTAIANVMREQRKAKEKEQNKNDVRRNGIRKMVH